MVIKAVLFDLDNTLIENYDELNEEALNIVFEEFSKKYNFSKIQLKQLYDISKIEVYSQIPNFAASHRKLLKFKKIIEKIFSKPRIDLVFELNQNFWNYILGNLTVSKTTYSVLDNLKKQGLKLALISDLTCDIQLKKLMRTKLDNYFDVILTSEEYSFDKPYPFGFLLALNQLNISSKEAIMLGDSVEKDILGANNVGITGVLLSNKKLDSKKISLIKPNFQIKSLTELENLINEINVSSSEGYTKYNCMFKHDNLTKYNNIFLKINPFREKLYDLGLIGAYKNKVGFGNISTRINNNSENYFLISGTKTGNFMKLRLKDYSLVIDYDISKNELTCKGETKASSESLTHAVTYELNSNINAVIHIHSKKMWDFYLDKVPTTSKDATYGTPEIAKEIKRLYSEDEFSKTQFAVLGGHEEGLLVYGSSLDEAYEVLMEYLCYYNQSIKKA